MTPEQLAHQIPHKAPDVLYYQHTNHKQMNYKLLLTFLFTELVEFTVFWWISVAIANYFSVGTLSIFLPIVGIDIIATVVVYGKRIPIFIDALFNREIEND